MEQTSIKQSFQKSDTKLLNKSTVHEYVANNCVRHLARIIFHECSCNVELVCCSCIFSCHLEHGTSRLDTLGSSSKPHVLHIRLSTHTGRYIAAECSC